MRIVIKNTIVELGVRFLVTGCRYSSSESVCTTVIFQDELQSSYGRNKKLGYFFLTMGM